MFKKLLVFSLASLMSFGAAMAQTPAKSFFVGITAGGGFGLGDLGKTKSSTSDLTKQSGYAPYGYSTAVNAGYLFTPNIGAALRYNSTGFFGLTSKVQEELKDVTLPSGTSRSEATAETFGFFYNTFMVGPRGAINAGSVEFFLQPMIGFATASGSAKSTRTKDVSNTSDHYETRTITNSLSSGLAYGASLGLRTAISKSVGFYFDANYTDLGEVKNSATLLVTSATVPKNGTPQSSTISGSRDLKMATSFLTLNFGLSVHF